MQLIQYSYEHFLTFLEYQKNFNLTIKQRKKQIYLLDSLSSFNNSLDKSIISFPYLFFNFVNILKLTGYAAIMIAKPIIAHGIPIYQYFVHSKKKVILSPKIKRPITPKDILIA